jgi:hypothetical protein
LFLSSISCDVDLLHYLILMQFLYVRKNLVCCIHRNYLILSTYDVNDYFLLSSLIAKLGLISIDTKISSEELNHATTNGAYSTCANKTQLTLPIRIL